MRNYCKLFIHIPLSHDDVVSMIARIVSGICHRYRINTKLMEIYVQYNNDYDEKLAILNNDGFLYYKYFLDIEPAENADRGVYILAIGNLLNRLWQDGFRAVAACDFENELPQNGGYKLPVK